MKIKEDIRKRPAQFIDLCENHKVKNIHAFGSTVNGKFKETSSDVDLLVEIDTENPIERGENLMQLWDGFENFFHRKVDLLTASSIKNPILRKNIDSTKIMIYDRGDKKVLF